MAGDAEPGYLTWGPATVKLLRTMRLEAARSGNTDVLPAHVLVALLDQPEMHQGLRTIGALPDVYTIRAQVAASSLAPEGYQEEMPLSSAAQRLLDDARPHREGEPFELLYPLVLKAVLQNEACRLLLRRSGCEPGVLATVLEGIS